MIGFVFFVGAVFSLSLYATPHPNHSLVNLKYKALSENYSLDVRWKATLGWVAQTSSSQEVEELLGHKEWFIRNATLKALELKGTAEFEEQYLAILANDPSLVVRTQVVKNLKPLLSSHVSRALSVSLFAQNNFRKGKSLWIRKHIVEALLERASSTKTADRKSVV